jgi:psp operon transcriptional activator PspF
VIILTGAGDPDGAALAIRNGAWDYLQKPLSPKKILLPLKRVLKYRDTLRLKSAPPMDFKRCGIVGDSPAMHRVLEKVSAAARSGAGVLITGETGTGKELFARAVHENSNRATGPFVVVDCASIPANLLESTLFGHVKGAFTGADKASPGLIQEAHGGTLFLDEIGNLPLTAQEKILRAVEYGEFERVGGSTKVDVDVRLVCATNADLPAMVRDGKFKADLLDRLAFEVLRLPPLRHRQGDVMLLARHFTARMSVEMGYPGPPEFGPAAVEALENHPWPGNVRELKNVVERAVYRAGGGPVTEVDLDPFDVGKSQEHTDIAQQALSMPQGGLRGAVEDLKVGLARQALESAHGNQAEAARLLGLTYDQFRGLYRKHRHALENA